jgi:hypothetical protein
VNVVVENVNDMPPEFTSPMVNIRNLVLRENMDNDSLFLITATDTEFNKPLQIFIEVKIDNPPSYKEFYFQKNTVILPLYINIAYN